MFFIKQFAKLPKWQKVVQIIVWFVAVASVVLYLNGEIFTTLWSNIFTCVISGIYAVVCIIRKQVFWFAMNTFVYFIFFGIFMYMTSF